MRHIKKQVALLPVGTLRRYGDHHSPGRPGGTCNALRVNKFGVGRRWKRHPADRTFRGGLSMTTVIVYMCFYMISSKFHVIMHVLLLSQIGGVNIG